MHTRGTVSVQDITVLYTHDLSKPVKAVESLSFEVGASEFVCLLGPSGCGKSTTLKTIAGFIEPATGTILVDGQPIAGPDSDRGVVFQEQALFPWKTVAGNIEFGPKMKGMNKGERQVKVRHYLSLVKLDGYEWRYPNELSGGERQRVALARALVNEPRVLLMDEPFGEVDALTRMWLQEVLLDIWERLRVSVIFVTHDVDEAIYLGDRVLVMTGRPGRIKQEIEVSLGRPRSREVATSSEFYTLKKEVLGLIFGEQPNVVGRVLAEG